MSLPQPIEILGVQVHPLTVAQLHEEMDGIIQRRDHALVLNVNVHCLNLASQRPWLHDFLNRAEIVFCDGAGVILGARLLGQEIPERITYADWFWELAEWCSNSGYSLYFLGAKPGVADAAAAKLQARYPELRIVGCHHGYFEMNGVENQAVIDGINTAEPDILVLGFGMPLQEQWLMSNWDKLNTNIALTGGAVFDYISGELTRAPAWMTNNGLEWLGRLLIEPGRLWKRYLVGNPAFLVRIMRQKVMSS